MREVGTPYSAERGRAASAFDRGLAREHDLKLIAGSGYVLHVDIRFSEREPRGYRVTAPERDRELVDGLSYAARRRR